MRICAITILNWTTSVVFELIHEKAAGYVRRLMMPHMLEASHPSTSVWWHWPITCYIHVHNLDSLKVSIYKNSIVLGQRACEAVSAFGCFLLYAIQIDVIKVVRKIYIRIHYFTSCSRKSLYINFLLHTPLYVTTDTKIYFKQILINNNQYSMELNRIWLYWSDRQCVNDTPLNYNSI
jgi:hypothetical protein